MRYENIILFRYYKKLLFILIIMIKKQVSYIIIFDLYSYK